MQTVDFETKQDAIDAGYTFVGGKIIEYINEDGRCIGSIQRVDVTPGASFGYEFAISAYYTNGKGRTRLGIFGESTELFIRKATNKGGGTGAYYTSVFRAEVYEQAMAQARAVIRQEAPEAIERSYQGEW